MDRFTTGSTRWCLQPIQVAHLHCCKKVCCISQNSLKSLEEILEDRHRERWTWLYHAAGPVSALLWEEKREKHCQSPTKPPPADYSCAFFWLYCQKQTTWAWDQVPASFIAHTAQHHSGESKGLWPPAKPAKAFQFYWGFHFISIKSRWINQQWIMCVTEGEAQFLIYTSYC